MDALARHLGFQGATDEGVHFIENMMEKDINGDGKIGDGASITPGGLRTPEGLTVEQALAKAGTAKPTTPAAAGGLSLTIPVKVVSANGVLLAEATVNEYIANFNSRVATGAPSPKGAGG